MRFLKTFFLVSILISISNTAFAGRSVVMFFGDSISLGRWVYSDPYNRGDGRHFGPSINKFEDLVVANNRSALAINWGWGGSTSMTGVNRISADLQTTINQHTGDRYIVLLHYGTNDVGQGLSTDTLKTNTKLMIDKANAKNVIPVVGSLLRTTKYGGISTANTKILSAANSKNVCYANLNNYFGGNWQSLLSDGLHPTSSGYQRVVEGWFGDCLAGIIPEEEPEFEPTIMAPIIYLLLED